MLSNLRNFLTEKRAEREGDEKGFTLIELMVVLLIIAILVAIAIPTYLGVRNRANDRAAQSTLRNALTTAEAAYANTDDYLQANAAGLSKSEPNITFTDSGGTASTDPNSVQVNGGGPSSAGATTGNQWWEATSFSKSGHCFYILTIKQTLASAEEGETAPGTYYAVSGGSQTSCSVPSTGVTFTNSTQGWQY
jgi:type IV pilus assembly protein PilA